MQVTYIGHQRPSKNPSINWYICKISTTDIADTWHNNVGHSLAHEHRQGHVISRILSIGMRMQGIFGSFVRVCRVGNSTTSVQCKPPYVWTDMVQGCRSTVWCRRLVLPYGTKGGQFVLQFDLSTAGRGSPKKSRIF